MIFNLFTGNADTADTTAVPPVVREGYFFYDAQGVKVPGTLASYGDCEHEGLIWTPSQEQQIIPTADKHLVGDITINPIPDTFKRMACGVNAIGSSRVKASNVQFAYSSGSYRYFVTFELQITDIPFIPAGAVVMLTDPTDYTAQLQIIDVNNDVNCCIHYNMTSGLMRISRNDLSLSGDGEKAYITVEDEGNDMYTRCFMHGYSYSTNTSDTPSNLYKFNVFWCVWS